jgi:hypothetical protein
MHLGMLSIVTTVAVVTLWGLLSLYCWRCARRRRRWQAHWDEFASQQSSLDAQLDRTWDHLQRLAGPQPPPDSDDKG